MALDPDDVTRLNDRAGEVGQKIGWDLKFIVAPNTEYVGVVAGPDQVFVLGPSGLSDMAAHDIELDLDALERGDRQLRADEDGDPRLY
jgi:hypothetical protein